MYYWRVRAKNPNVAVSSWSTMWHFKSAAPSSGGGGGGGCTSCCVSSVSSLDRITISDASGNHQDFFAFNDGRVVNLGLRNFEIPPEPPPGVFSARFKSGKFIEQIP